MEQNHLLPFDLANPWLLLVPLAIAVLLIFRSGGFIRLSGGDASPPESFRTRLRTRLPDLLLLIALFAAGLGIAGLRGNDEKKIVTTTLADRFIVTQDQSGSMFNGASKRTPLRCIFKKERETLEERPVDLSSDPPSPTGDPREDLRLNNEWTAAWSMEQLLGIPRIDGSCRAIESLLDELDRRRVTQPDVVHQVAYSTFATTAALHVPFTSDLKNIRESISSMNWHNADIEVGSSTNFNEALYLMIAASLRRHIEGDKGFTRIPPDVANALLGPAIEGLGNVSAIDDLFAAHPGLLEKLRKEISDTTLVLITDGEEPAMWVSRPSMEKMLYIARLFEMPVFVLSTEADEERLRTLLPTTGGDGRRGEFFLLNKIEGYASMPDIMRSIIDRSFARAESRVVQKPNSYVAWCAGIALFALLGAFFLRKSVFGRTITG